MASCRVGPPRRVLIVEDHPVIALRLRLALSCLGQEVVGVAQDTAEAHRFDPQCIDLAIVDLNLADGPTGLQIAAYLGEAGVPIVFHTTEPQHIPDGFPHTLGVLDKPTSTEALYELIQAISTGPGPGARGVT